MKSVKCCYDCVIGFVNINNLEYRWLKTSDIAIRIKVVQKQDSL